MKSTGAQGIEDAPVSRACASLNGPRRPRIEGSGARVRPGSRRAIRPTAAMGHRPRVRCTAGVRMVALPSRHLSATLSGRYLFLLISGLGRYPVARHEAPEHVRAGIAGCRNSPSSTGALPHAYDTIGEAPCASSGGRHKFCRRSGRISEDAAGTPRDPACRATTREPQAWLVGPWRDHRRTVAGC